MNTGICVCVLLATLSTSSCFFLPSQSEDGVQSDLGTLAEDTRHARVERSSGQLKLLPKDSDVNPRSIGSLLARLIPSIGGRLLSGSSQGFPNMNSRLMGPNQRMRDRDYQGWMDFGRRSAEGSEYS